MKKTYKNLFDLCVGTDAARTDGEEFKTARISEDLASRFGHFREQVNQVQEKGSVPCLVTIFKFLLNLVWICIFGGMIQACGKGTSWKEMYENVPMFFYVGGGTFLLWLLIQVVEKLKMKRAIETSDIEGMMHQADVLEAQLHMEIGIPEDAPCVDIIHQCYEMKKGKKKILHAMSYPFVNPEVYVYRKGDMLCFCDRTDEYSIPMDRIRGVELFKKPVQVSGWNKDEPITDDKYKEFKPSQTDAGYFVKQHYMIYVQGDAEEYIIRIPNYDFAKVESCVGGKIEERRN